MKKKNNPVPAPSKLNLLRQICNFIPDFLVARLARETGVKKKIRTFSAWSHVLSLIFAQLTHSIGLNDVCDALGLHSGPLSSLRERRRPAATIYPTATRSGRRRWPKSFFGECSNTWAISRRALSAVKQGNDLPGNSSEPFIWWTQRPSP